MVLFVWLKKKEEEEGKGGSILHKSPYTENVLLNLCEVIAITTVKIKPCFGFQLSFAVW